MDKVQPEPGIQWYQTQPPPSITVTEYLRTLTSIFKWINRIINWVNIYGVQTGH